MKADKKPASLLEEKMKMKSRVLPGILSLAVMLIVTACATPAAPAQPTVAPAAVPTMAPTAVPPTATPTTPPTTGGGGASPSSAASLMIAKNPMLGAFLADDQGRTLYLFTKDTKGTSNCYDQCAQAWPPLVSSGQPTLKDGVSTDLISTTVRKDGSVQLTYNGWPLYYYAKDKAPGDTTGQAVSNVWWVVSGEGNAIKPATVAIPTRAASVAARPAPKRPVPYSTATADNSNAAQI